MSSVAIHHVIPAAVLEKNASFFQAIYGQAAGGSFGMSADFSTRLEGTPLRSA